MSVQSPPGTGGVLHVSAKMKTFSREKRRQSAAVLRSRELSALLERKKICNFSHDDCVKASLTESALPLDSFPCGGSELISAKIVMLLRRDVPSLEKG